MVFSFSLHSFSVASNLFLVVTTDFTLSSNTTSTSAGHSWWLKQLLTQGLTRVWQWRGGAIFLSLSMVLKSQLWKLVILFFGNVEFWFVVWQIHQMTDKEYNLQIKLCKPKQKSFCKIERCGGDWLEFWDENSRWVTVNGFFLLRMASF